MHNSSNTIEVTVIKPFNELRTPCPPAGTIGEIYNFDGKFSCVRFLKPMVDQEGTIWTKEFDEEDDINEYMFLKFLTDEISLV